MFFYLPEQFSQDNLLSSLSQAHAVHKRQRLSYKNQNQTLQTIFAHINNTNLINLSGSYVVFTGQLNVHKPLIVPEIKINLSFNKQKNYFYNGCLPN